MILVTGGAGFIGSNLVAALSDRGAEVVVCDRLGGDEQWRNLAKHAVVEIVDPQSLPAWLDSYGGAVEAVFHMGATSSTVARDVDHLVENNFAFSMRLWRWCAAAGRPLIYASSAATYGDGSQGFDDDNDPAVLARLRPLNPYGWSKQLFDRNALRLAARGTAPRQWAGLKFFNVYGPNEYHKGGQRSVAAQLYEEIAASGRARLFRSHVPEYPDGGQQRDFIWVGDCVAVMLWLYENPTVNGIFNCGTGRARSFAELAHACFAAMGRAARIDYVDTPENIRAQYQYFTEARMDRLRAAGYGTPFTTLEDGVAIYIQEFLATDDRYR